MANLETDYLIVGAGASGLAFADTLLDETDANILMVDRRDKPGGHWNDVYPFVGLHQPSSYYGVASTPLGAGRIDTTGLNKGYEELASGPEIVSYFHSVMRDRLIASDRVTFLPMTEHIGDGGLRNMLSGKTSEVTIRRRLVDARLLENGIPLTHTPNFDIAEGVACTPPNALPLMAKRFGAFTILGAGKTAMDSVIWLLANGAEPGQIRWVVPRDPWMINRAFSQPSGAFYRESYGGTMHQMEAMRDAKSLDELADRMEMANVWFRLDPDVRPQIMHGPTVSQAEIEQMRRVHDIVRLGHVTQIEPDKMTLAQGTCHAVPETLYVDCTARALGHTKTWPIFTQDRIAIQMIRLYQPTFSAALLAKIEASFDNDQEKNAVATPVPMTDTVQNWVQSQLVGTLNQASWSQHPELRAWISACRLDGFGRAAREVDREDPTVQEIYGRIKAASMPAFANMQKLANQNA